MLRDMDPLKHYIWVITQPLESPNLSQAAMYLKSMYPNLPAYEDQNVHNFFFNRPDQKDWSNHTLYVDSVTEKNTRFREFRERVNDGATALGAPSVQNGLGLKAENEEMVGILGENSMVGSFDWSLSFVIDW